MGKNMGIFNPDGYSLDQIGDLPKEPHQRGFIPFLI
jgi:hypothetical protein